MSQTITRDFRDLFTGSDLTYGQWNPKNGKMHTENVKAPLEAFSKHLNGEYGIGIVPVNSDGNCWWGAIDIDNHGGEPININIIAKTIYGKGIPLVPCLSKSGGVHCYLFTSEPVPAVIMQRTLQRWAREIGYGDAEIFPKQEELRDNLTGNWLNLPYFEAIRTPRYAVEARGEEINRLSMQDFIKYAHSCRLTLSMLKSFVLAGHEQAPPCLQSLIINGAKQGMRNEVLYGFTVYLRKKFPPSTYKQEILTINKQIFDKPLPLSEANRTITSASRREYKYKCMESPFRDYCDSATCLKRDFGIEPSEEFETGEGVPEIERIRVMSTEPPLWEITINDTQIMVDTKSLRRHDLLAEKIMESLLIVIPILKQRQWMPILANLMLTVETIEAPDNASINGVIRERLIEFIDRADFNSNGKDPSDKDLIMRGLPVIQEEHDSNGKRVVMFRGSDFISFLKRTRTEELKGNSLWMAVRKMGVKHGRSRIQGRVINVWSIPVDGRGRTKLDYDYDKDVIFVKVKDSVVKLMTGVNF